MGKYVIELLALASLYMIGSMSLSLVVGRAGLLSVAHGAFMGIGAYIAAILANAGWSIGLAILAAVIGTALISGILGFSSLQLPEDQFVVVTLAFHLLVVNILVNWKDVTQGAYGISGITRPTIVGDLLDSQVQFVILVVVLVAIVYLVMQRIATSPFGLLLQASAGDKDVVEGLGASVRVLRTKAFMLGSAGAGLAGGLYAAHAGYIAPEIFELHASILLLSMVVVGGAGNMLGALLGAGLLILLPEALRFAAFPVASAGPLRQIIFGLLLTLAVYFRARQAHRRAVG